MNDVSTKPLLREQILQTLKQLFSTKQTKSKKKPKDTNLIKPDPTKIINLDLKRSKKS